MKVSSQRSGQSEIRENEVRRGTCLYWLTHTLCFLTNEVTEAYSQVIPAQVPQLHSAETQGAWLQSMLSSLALCCLVSSCQMEFVGTADKAGTKVALCQVWSPNHLP